MPRMNLAAAQRAVLRSASRLLGPSALALLALMPPAAAPLAARQACPDPASMQPALSGPLSDVRYLADDRLEGREVGTAGARCAADYLVDRFEAMGLEPAGEDGSWFHTFPIPGAPELGESSRLEISGNTYVMGREWTPVGFSAEAVGEGDLVYAGHMLSRPGAPEDRSAHTDVDGRIVVVEWGDPDNPRGGLRSGAHFKATIAAGRGARGVVVLLPDGMDLPDPASERRSPLAVPVAVARGDAADRIRERARAGASVVLGTDVRPTTVEARNVVAVLPGTDPALADEYVVVGAHYDHLGMGGEGSLAPDARAIHNGADDNASGTAAMLEIARLLAEGPRPARSVVFMGFTGEEKGLWGSARWVEAPTRPLDGLVAMLNLDMVGRMSEDALTVFGVGTATEWEDVLGEENARMPRPLHLALAPDGYGPSDHASFFSVGIPVLHFFTNTHAEYHRPEDDWELVNEDGIRAVAELAAGVTRRLTSADRTAVALSPVQQEESTDPHGGAAPSDDSSSQSGGYGPYLGTIPDMTPRDFGLRLTGVREDSPAEEAGLRTGDVVVRFDGKEVGDIYAYTYALRDTEPGQRVEIVVERDGERVTLFAVMGERR